MRNAYALNSNRMSISGLLSIESNGKLDMRRRRVQNEQTRKKCYVMYIEINI